MQNYFGEAIRNNVGNIESMENDIWAIFKHIIRDNSQPLDEQHSLCPRDSWCTYWSNREKYNIYIISYQIFRIRYSTSRRNRISLISAQPDLKKFILAQLTHSAFAC